jgi:hypothetical protein
MEEEIQERLASDASRLDQRTKISLMTAIIFSTMEEPDVKQAVDKAWEIDLAVGDKIRWWKQQRRNAQQRQPITPSIERIPHEISRHR